MFLSLLLVVGAVVVAVDVSVVLVGSSLCRCCWLLLSLLFAAFAVVVVDVIGCCLLFPAVRPRSTIKKSDPRIQQAVQTHQQNPRAIWGGGAKSCSCSAASATLKGTSYIITYDQRG